MRSLRRESWFGFVPVFAWLIVQLLMTGAIPLSSAHAGVVMCSVGALEASSPTGVKGGSDPSPWTACDHCSAACAPALLGKRGGAMAARVAPTAYRLVVLPREHPGARYESTYVAVRGPPTETV